MDMKRFGPYDILSPIGAGGFVKAHFNRHSRRC
jgi:hypothetical protein